MKKLKWSRMEELGWKNYRAENIHDVNPGYAGPVVALELFFVPKGFVFDSRGRPARHGWTVIRIDANDHQVGGGFYHWRKAQAVRDANAIALDTRALNDTQSGGL
jgi:hypothetical protein